MLSSQISSANSTRFQYVILLHFCCLIEFVMQNVHGIIFYPRGSSFGYLAAVAMPLDIPYRNIYVAFNFESNYGLPSNDSYHEWIDRWNLDEHFVGIGNNVTNINGRSQQQEQHHHSQHQIERSLPHKAYTRTAFYRCFVGYLNYFGMNGTGCLLRTICEVTETSLDENNGLLGSLFKILFMPTTSAPEKDIEIFNGLYEAEHHGSYVGNCSAYEQWCPEGVINMISAWF